MEGKQGEKGQIVKLATMEQVTGWLRSVGMVEVKGSRAGSGPNGQRVKGPNGQMKAGETPATEWRGTQGTSAQSPVPSPSLFDDAVSEEVAKRISVLFHDFGSASLRVRLAQVQRELNAIAGKQLPPDASTAEIERRSAAMKNLSGEMRQIEESVREVEIKARRYVLMEEAQRTVREMALMLISDLERLPADISPTIAEAVEPMLAVAADGTRDVDSLRRLVMAAVRDAVARVREGRASLAEEAAARLKA